VQAFNCNITQHFLAKTVFLLYHPFRREVSDSAYWGASVSAGTWKQDLILISFLQPEACDRIGNFRVYILGGGKYDYDLASNSQRRQAEDLVKLVKGSFGYEAGFGFNFYFPSFIFSPEIKISNTFRNVHSRDPYLLYSNVIDRMQARMILFSIHLEG